MFGKNKLGVFALVVILVVGFLVPTASASGEADLWVSISFSPDVTMGLPLTLYFMVGNRGGSTAQDVELCVELPDAPWAVEGEGCTLDVYLGPVGPGELRSAIFTLLPQRSGHWRAEARVETSSPEADPWNDNWATLNLIIFEEEAYQIFLPLVLKNA